MDGRIGLGNDGTAILAFAVGCGVKLRRHVKI